MRPGSDPFRAVYSPHDYRFYSVSVRVSSLEVALGLILQRILREPARECGTSALSQSIAAQQIEAFSARLCTL